MAGTSSRQPQLVILPVGYLDVSAMAGISTVKPKLIYFITEDWFFCSHFLDRAIAAHEAGYEVIVAANEHVHAQVIRTAGLRFIPLKFDRHGLNPLHELKLFKDIWKIYRSERPNIVHHIAIKPILYGSLAAIFTDGIAIVNAPVGMGYVFSSKDRRANLLRPLIKLGYRLLINPKRSRVIFENPDDRESFIRNGAVNAKDAMLIRGAGVDIALFEPGAAPPNPITVVLVARMLWDKGVGEFVAAARLLTERGVSARFVLVGEPDRDNPAAVPEADLRAWHGQHGVEWWGRREDMVEVLHAAHIACLPSYREGLPKTLLEAAACGLPIVTTDAPGCREVVRDGDNGLLVPVRDASALADALRKLIENAPLRSEMGRRSRERAVAEFSREQIIAETLAVYQEVIR
jgi:glycosyltransferase involved in cell wall biosynthesis